MYTLVATSEPDVCDKCLGSNEDLNCGRDYISTEDFNKLEDLIMNKTEEMAIYIDNSMKEGTSMWFCSVSLADQLLGQLSSLRDRTIFLVHFLDFFLSRLF